VSSKLKKIVILNKGTTCCIDCTDLFNTCKLLLKHYLKMALWNKYSFLVFTITGYAVLQVGPAESGNPPKMFSEFFTDSFGRCHDYLRLSLTEKCNFRCNTFIIRLRFTCLFVEFYMQYEACLFGALTLLLDAYAVIWFTPIFS